MATVVDAYGRPYTPTKLPEVREIAVTGIRDKWATYPSHGLTPEKLARIFKDADQGDIFRQAELFEEMEEKDAHLGSVLQTRRLAVSGCNLEVTPASDSAEDKKIADFVKEAIGWIENWDDARTDQLDSIGKGFAVSEIMWELAEGKAWIRELKWRHQKRFTFYDHEEVLEYPRLLTDADPVRGELLPPNKFIYHRYRARAGTASRAGLLRPCAWMYLFKNYGIKDWIVFCEVYGMPLRIGRYEPGASKEDKEVLRQAVSSLGTDAAGVISKSTEIEFIESVKNAQGNVFELLVKFCDAQMSKAVLGQTATTEGTPGKLGSDDAQSEVRADLKQADAKALAKTFTMQMVRPLVGFNFGWEKSIPKLTMEYEEAEDLGATATTYKTLVEAGFKGIPTSHVHEKFSIPEPKDDEDTLQAPAVGGFTFPGAAPAPGPPESGKKPAPDPEEIPTGQEINVSQATVLNGAQVTAATAIVKSVTIGELPRDAGLGQLEVLFNLTKEQAEKMMGSAGTKTPTTPNPKPAADPGSDPPDKSNGSDPAEKAKQLVAKSTPPKDALDPMVEKALREAAGPMADLLEPVRALILKAESYEQITEGLGQIFPDMGSEEMTNLLQRVFAIAYLMGASEVADG